MAESVFHIGDVNKDIDLLNDNIAKSPEITTNSNGTAYKFANGLLICDKSVYKTNVACTNSWGSLYESTSEIDFGDWPVAFYNNPAVIANVVQGGNETILACSVEKITGYTTTYAGKTYVYRPTSATGNVRIHVVGIGKWKNV